MNENIPHIRKPHGRRPPASTLRIYTDAAITLAVTVLGFLLLSLAELEHTLVFLMALPIAIYTIRYSWVGALLPALVIVALGPWVHFAELSHGFILLPIAMIAGIVHGQVTNQLDNNPQLGFLIISLSEILLNAFAFLAFSVWISGSHFNMFDEVAHLAELLPTLMGFAEGSNRFIAVSSLVTGAVYAVVGLVAIFEAMITHILVHSLATRVFKLERGHTFTSMPFAIPTCLTTAYLSMSVVAWAFVGKLTQNPINFAETTILVAISISIFGTALYFFEGMALVNRFIAFRYHKRIVLVNTIIGLIFLPLTIILGIADSLFKIQPRVIMSLTTRIRRARREKQGAPAK